MGRPHIEFIQSQRLAWQPMDGLGRPGVDAKLLSADNMTGAASLLLRYPAGWRQAKPAFLTADEELFVLQGAVQINGVVHGRHSYAFLPRGHLRRDFLSTTGAVVLTFLSAAARTETAELPHADYDTARLVERIDSAALGWDHMGGNAGASHLHAARKTLRRDVSGRSHSYLSGGMPHSCPKNGAAPLEKHPHVEEMFLVAGDMPCSLGVLRAGAYFWRPAEVWHGADCTLTGFLAFVRTIGSSRTVSIWDEQLHPILWDPPHRPVLPNDLKPFGDPIDDPVEY